MTRILLCFFFFFMDIGDANDIVTPSPLPEEWNLVERLAPTNDIRVILSLKRLGLKKLTARAMEVSDPRSSFYGQYLNREQLIEVIEVNPKSRVIVENWLQSYNVYYNLGPNLDMIHIHTTIAQVEKLFKTTVYLVENKVTNQISHRASSLQIPSSVLIHITSIFGLHGLPLPPRKIRKKNPDPFNVTPAVLYNTYKISGVSISRSTKNRQAVVEFGGEYMNSIDLKTYFQNYVKNAKAGDENVYKFVGKHVEGEGLEALLDIEYIMGLAPGIKTEFWERYPTNDFCLDLLNWTQTILGSDDAPLVHSVSYGYQGNLSQLGCKQQDVDTIDAEFQKIAAKGITIIFASGDSGSGQGYKWDCNETYNQGYSGTPITNFTLGEPIETCCWNCTLLVGCAFYEIQFHTNQCVLYDSKATPVKRNNSVSGPKYIMPLYPSWPASSPWVTAVGATRFINNAAGTGPEMASDQFGSGGGFSTMFQAPDWQKQAVDSYFANVPASSQLPPAGSYPRGGRATPDISVLGEGYQTIYKGNPISVGGTSASAPAFAAMVSLLNEARMGASKPALGFLNPFIYQHSEAFMDVTAGNNRIDRSGGPLLEGWDCIKGWDPVTGFGTPDFQKLLKAALN